MPDDRDDSYLRTLGELYRARLEAARANPPPWDGGIEQASARVFEALDETFGAAKLLNVVAPSTVALDEAAGYLAEWVALGMVAEPEPGAFAKTGERPYRTDRGMLS